MAWNVLTVAIRPAPAPRWPTAQLVVDGSDLIDLVRDRDGRPDRWSHPTVRDVVRGSPLGLLEVPDDGYDLGKSRILACSCGIYGCGDLLARVVLRERSVMWRDFQAACFGAAGASQPRAPYDQLGPFKFERDAYEAALAPCRDAYLRTQS